MHGNARISIAIAVLAASLANVPPAAAHHALDAMYDTATEVETLATLRKVDWINPHAWMRFEVQFSNGHIEGNVLVETVGISGLRQMGISRDSLKIGDKYKIYLYPSRDGSATAFMTRLVATTGAMLGESVFEPDDNACQGPCGPSPNF